MDILVQAFGSPEALLEALSRGRQYINRQPEHVKGYDTDSFLSEIVAFLSYKSDDTKEYQYVITDENLIVNYRMETIRRGQYSFYTASIIGRIDSEGREVIDQYKPNIFALYHEVLQSLDDREYWSVDDSLRKSS